MGQSAPKPENETKNTNDDQKLAHVLLLGDSTIDNVAWVKGEGKSVCAHLRSMLGEDVKVTNYAADGFNTHHMLHGAMPSISWSARIAEKDPFPLTHCDTFYPLKQAQGLQGVTHIVLSVGGNDIREILGNMQLLSTRLEGFWKNYPAILDQCLKMTPRVCIMLQYRPCRKQRTYRVYEAMSTLPGPQTGVEKLNGLMEKVYQPIFALARKHHLPLVDLTRSFDIDDASLYRSQIEPSAKGGARIAEILVHVLRTHSFGGGKSGGGGAMFYVKRKGSNSIESEPCDEKGSWKIAED
uniref:SGNH hydrolase-type esterase domain-containing protein n=1 Tax=Lotharella globosa TaxID=91324 RepID=A0A7S3Z9A9_9EUKA|mmetsp:Transcript_17768/g.35845  ORF Transcript_17768/g.35845 Transcript_17768/m.35845 type:complete len:296 (+) Transcript_17768:34-921(+)